MLAKAKSRSTNPPKPRLPSEKALEIRIFIGPFHGSPHDVPESTVTSVCVVHDPDCAQEKGTSSTAS